MSAAVSSLILVLWSGVVLGGSLIAAPAKFQAQSLTLEVALDVGRAQFSWVGIAEGALCAAFLIARAAFGGVSWLLAAIPVGIFLVQRFIIMPPLDARTLQVIAGENVGDSHLHRLFIILEGVKFLLLIILGFWGVTAANGGR